MIPQEQTVPPVQRPASAECLATGPLLNDVSRQGSYTLHTILLSPVVDKWTSAMEKEFRKLALEEIKGTLSQQQQERLDGLAKIRDGLFHPRPVEDIFIQLKRDRVLDKLAEALKEYVEFQASTHQAGRSA